VVRSFNVASTVLVLPTIRMIPIGATDSYSAILGWSGRRIGDQADTISDYAVPTMTYEESLAQIQRLNLGIAGQVKTREFYGEEQLVAVEMILPMI
jgi:hypothetical protein